ncbi:MAG: hypothetical protein DCC67_10575 [Planctomycetota bacterium]|nr:MAG: hypothetical protein DCC67_10575 [Planctomycetota bacterium]
MLHAERPLPPVAIVVRWPRSAPAAVAEQMHQCLTDGGLAATWAMESPEQAALLECRGGRAPEMEAAILAVSAGGDGLNEAIGASIDVFQAAGMAVETIQVSGKLPRDSFARRLCQAGIRAVVGSAITAKTTVAGALPFGVWQFSPHWAAPARRRWFQFFSRRNPALLENSSTSLAVAAIDLGAVDSIHGRAWRQVEELLEQLCEAQDTGIARIATVAQLAAELTAAATSRPQRSILRAA